MLNRRVSPVPWCVCLTVSCWPESNSGSVNNTLSPFSLIKALFCRVFHSVNKWEKNNKAEASADAGKTNGSGELSFYTQRKQNHTSSLKGNALRATLYL